MNTRRPDFMGRMIRHWVTSTPLPEDGRKRLLAAAANNRPLKIGELSWFCAISPSRRNLQYFLYMTWPITDGLQARSAAAI